MKITARTATTWKDEDKKTRVFTSHGPTGDYPEPQVSEHPCVKGDCDGHLCRRAHGAWFLEFMGVDPDAVSGAYGDADWGRKYLRTPEVDHRVWKSYSRRCITAERPLVVAALREYLVISGVKPKTADATASQLKVHHSIHAGCSMCPCSPGWVVTGMKGVDIWVDFRDEAIIDEELERAEDIGALVPLAETQTLEEASA